MRKDLIEYLEETKTSLTGLYFRSEGNQKKVLRACIGMVGYTLKEMEKENKRRKQLYQNGGIAQL